MRSLGLAAVASLGVAVIVVLTRDPDEVWAVVVAIASVAAAAGLLATLLQLRGARHARRGPSAAQRATAGRRGLEVAAVVGLLLWLRAVDGLSLLTAAFIVGTFVVAEAVLSARPVSSR